MGCGGPRVRFSPILTNLRKISNLGELDAVEHDPEARGRIRPGQHFSSRPE